MIFQRPEGLLLDHYSKIEKIGAVCWLSAQLEVVGPKTGALRTTTGALMRPSNTFR